MRRFINLHREDGKQLEISTHYTKGGKSFMFGHVNPRGLYVHFTLISSVSAEKEGAPNIIMTELGSKDNFKILWREFERYPTKQRQHLDFAVMGCAEKLASLYQQGDREAIYNTIIKL